MMKKCCILIPIYQPSLSEKEEHILNGCYQKLQDYPFLFMVPGDLDTAFYQEKYPNMEIIRFSTWHSESLSDYNRLLLQIDFYETFIQYEYLFIFQLDGLFLGTKEQFETFLRADVDYIGAPWGEEGYRFCRWIIPGAGHSRLLYALEGSVTCYVGNGGVSLRKTAQMMHLLKEKKRQVIKWKKAEDIFFSYHGQKSKCHFKIASKELAYQFAMESDMQQKIEQGQVPMAVHKWEKYYPALFDRYKGEQA